MHIRMDSGVDEELNYEEDELECDESHKHSQNMQCTQDNVTNNSNSESDDQYLQIDYLEDENLVDENVHDVNLVGENLADEKVADNTVPQESPSTIPNNNEKAVEKNENSNQENVSIVKEELNPIKKSDDDVGSKTKRKNRVRQFQQENASIIKEELNPIKKSDDVVSSKTKRKNRVRQYQRRMELKKKLTNAFCLNPWLPEYNILDRQRQFAIRSSMLNAKQEFYPLQGSSLLQMMPNSTGYLHSPSTGLGIGVSSRNFLQQSNVNMLGQPFISDGSGYQVQNGQILLSGSFGYKAVKPDIFSKDCNINNSSGFDLNKNVNKINRPNGNNFQTNNSTKNGYKTLPYNGNATNMSTAFKEQESKCFPVKSEFINNVQYKPFQEEEKKVIMMKKEARLKRFMQDDLIKKDKLTDSGFEESSQFGSPPKVQLSEKKEEKIIIDVKPKDFVSSNEREAKPDINKELLLRKRNPFGGGLGTSNLNLATKANQNEKINRVKVERVDTKACIFPGEQQQPIKVEAKLSAPSQTIGPIKTETEPHVKFFRTISKSFDELTFKKPKIVVPESQGNLFPFEGSKIGENLPKQLEPQLTGCIVKVLNIPPSTTTNDILALCSPIGIVLEVKLNCPKENSVVIRFAEPKFAEKFFSLYHGQKMNNYFLNVIIV